MILLFSVSPGLVVLVGALLVTNFLLALRRRQHERNIEKSLFLHTIKLDHIMENLSQFEPILNRIDTATNDIAGDLRRIKDQLSTGMSPAQVQELKNLLEQKASTLEGIAASTENPVPEEGGGTTGGEGTTG